MQLGFLGAFFRAEGWPTVQHVHWPADSHATAQPWRLWPSLAVASLYALAIWWMSLSVRYLEVGLAYAVWAGVSTALTAVVVGMLWFGEPFHSTRLIGIAFVVGGVICLNLDGR